MSRTRINITSTARPLVRVTYGDGQITIEADLAGDVAAQAIGDAMLRLCCG